MPLSTDLPVGAELLGYRIEEVLGRGGMGVVYLAEDRRLRRKVALKLLAPRLAGDERFGERLLSESELAASLDHPNIVPIYEAGEADGRIFISMRFVEGLDLRRVLKDGPLGAEKALALVSQVASALDAAHARGLVHRDVKPSNVLIAPAAGHEGSDHVYLADFGLSRRLAEAKLYGEGQSLGTVDYVAPEQIRGEDVDGRADLYSLGCLLYECLAGRPPFSGYSDAQILFAHLEDEPPQFPGLEKVFGRALAKSPDGRFQSGRELVEAARDALGLAAPRRRRGPGVLTALGVLLLAVALVTALVTRGEGGVSAEPGADSLVRISPGTNKVMQTIPVGRTASGVAADGPFVWVASAGDGTVWRIDPGTRGVLRLSTHGTPTSVAVSSGQAVVADGSEKKVAVFDAATGVLRYATALNTNVPFGELRVAAGPRGAWFADPLPGVVGKVDDVLSSGSPSVQVPIPRDESNFNTAYHNFDGLAVGEGGLWVTGDPFGRTVWRVDPRTGRVVAAIRVPFVPGAIAAGEGAVWVTSLLGDTVSRIDPATNRITTTIAVGRGPEAIATGAGAVWVTSAIDDTVWRIDPRTNRVVAKVPVPGAPGSVAVGASGVWVTAAKASPPAATGEIKIGVYADCSGPYAGFYGVSLAGAELPLIERGGRPGVAVTDGVGRVSVGGRPVRLYFGCTATSSLASVLTEARRLVEKVGVQVLIGPTDTNEELALQQYARQHPAVAFVDGSGAAPVVDPAPNFFSFEPNGAQWIAGLGGYAYRKLGWRTAVTITDPILGLYGWGQSAAFAAEFCSLGGTIIKRIWIPPGTTDLSGVIAQIPQAGVGGLFVSGFDSEALALASGYEPLRRNVSRRMVVATAAVSQLLRQLGRRASGLVSGGPFLDLPGAYPDPGLAPSGTYLTDFARAFPRIPSAGLGGLFDVPYYDAMAATVAALDQVHGDVSSGERRFRAALAKLNLDAPNGRTTLDSRHRAIAPNYVWQLQGPRLVPRVIRTIPNVEPTFGGYFSSHDPPPSETTPACRRRTPPPWIR